MKRNNDNCHLILSLSEKRHSYSNRRVSSKVFERKLLGIHIEYSLKFDTHIETICK